MEMTSTNSGTRFLGQNVKIDNRTSENSSSVSLNGVFNETATSSTSLTTTSAPDNSGLHVEYFVLAVGMLGIIANALMLIALAFFKKNRQHVTNILIINQMALDLCACCALVVVYAQNVSPFANISGYYGFMWCVFYGSITLGIGMVGSIVGLAVITVERYIKIVHAIIHKRYYRKWMIYVAVAIPWIDGFITNAPVGILSNIVVEGRCYTLAIWTSTNAKLGYGLFAYIGNFLVPVFIFIFCYIRIALVIQSRTKTAPGTTNITTAEKPNNKHTNVIKTLMLVALAFFICWCPIDHYFFLYNLGFNVSFTSNAWYLCMSFAYINSFLNPLLYAWQYNPIQKSVRLLSRRFRGLAVNDATLNVELSATGDGVASYQTHSEKHITQP